jgi:hypothetical protein
MKALNAFSVTDYLGRLVLTVLWEDGTVMQKIPGTEVWTNVEHPVDRAAWMNTPPAQSDNNYLDQVRVSGGTSQL